MVNKSIKTVSFIRLTSTIILFLVGFLFADLQAQSKYVMRAREAYQAKKWSAAQKIAAKGLEKQRDDYELYYIKAIAEFQMSEMSKYSKGDVNYAKDAVKSAVKARKYDDKNIFYATYVEAMKPIVLYNNQQALANYAQKKYSQAVQMYRNSYDLTGDTVAFGMMGYSQYLKGDEADAVRTMRTVAQWNFGANSKGLHPQSYVRESFEVLTDYYLKKQQGDSAIYYCEMGLEVFSKNIKLLAWEKQMISTALSKTKEKTGLSSIYNNLLEKGLYYFPSDSFFLHQQNAYFLNRIGRACYEKNFADAEIFHLDFYSRKQDLISRKSVNKSDPFLLVDSIGFAARGLEYFLGKNDPTATLFYFKKWYCQYYKIPVFGEKQLESILSTPPQQLSRRLVGMLMDEAISKYPKNKLFRQHRLNIYNDWTKKPIPYYEWERILRFSDSVIKDFPKNALLKQDRTKLYGRAVDSCVKSGKMELAWKIYYQWQDKGISLPKDLVSYQEKIAMADFELRFKGSKISAIPVKGSKTKKIVATGWTGNVKDCEAGTLPDSTLIKVANRLNYFRQNSGALLALSVDPFKVKGCLEASLVYSNKGVFTQTLKPETHACYTDLAAMTAELGMAVMEPNPAQSATALMADKGSTGMLTRRMIIHPAFNDFGVGCTENNSVFWIADNEKPVIDSGYWKTHSLSWPAAGASPAMLVFDVWSYSSLQDFSGATVTLKSEKLGVLPVEVNPITGSDIGLPMLTWKLIESPEIAQKMSKDKNGRDVLFTPGDKITVSIVLKSKKAISYTVKTF
ncbi:MAG: hypothetical protein RLZZ252_733 [Bacteroidota bacterium]|jgi:pentatricopeptide repeat protein